MRPMLAEDFVESKLQFPYCMEPKIDGVRGVHLHKGFTGRSLNPFANRFTNTIFAHPLFRGLDGELAAAHQCNPALCRITTSALNSREGCPDITWWLFDYLHDDGRTYYWDRYHLLNDRVRWLQEQPEVIVHAQRLRVVPMRLVHSLDEMNAQDAEWLDMGYEGSIIRRPDRGYKFGRSTPTEGGLLRIKRFIEEDAVVNSITEGRANGNEAVINALGQTERSTHQANMTPNGMVGSLECTDVKTGKAITVSAGTMPHDDRVLYFSEPWRIVGKTIKYKSFPKGVKDKPRFPTFQSIRLEEDKA